MFPLQIDEMRVEVTYETIDEVRRELEAQGISIEMVKKALHQPFEAIDDHNVVQLDIKH